MPQDPSVRPAIMTLTVVIPTRNRATLLRSAIASVMASPLMRSASDLIVVDDGSEDETAEIVRSSGVRYVRTSGGGPSGSRNAGWRLAETEYVSFLDDDDGWLPGNMQPQLNALENAPASAFAFGRVQRTDADLRPFGKAIPDCPLPSGLVVDFLAHYELQVGAILFRRSALESVAGFDTALRFYEDSDLLMRLAARYSAEGVDMVGSVFRQRGQNPRDAALRWEGYEARAEARRKWRRAGIRISLRARVRSDIHFRGMTSFFFCEDARAALTDGRMGDATTALIRGLRVSPLHCLVGHRRFWSVLKLFWISRARATQAEVQ